MAFSRSLAFFTIKGKPTSPWILDYNLLLYWQLLKLSYGNYAFQTHLGDEEVTTLESQDTQHHYRFHVSIARVTVVTMLTVADSNFFSQFNMSDYGTYIFNRVKSLVDVYLEKEDAEISKLIGNYGNGLL